MSERIKSHNVLEVTDYEEEISLLIKLKCTVTVAEPPPPI